MTKKDVRAAFTAIGYKVSIKKVSFADRSWYHILSGIAAIDNGNVYTPALFTAHGAFFALRNKFDKLVLPDGLRIIV